MILPELQSLFKMDLLILYWWIESNSIHAFKTFTFTL